MKNFYSPAAACCKKTMLYFLCFCSFAVNAQESMRANLYVVGANGTTLVDGNLTNYNNIYSNNIDVNDAWKMENPGINFGIWRAATNLVVERRSIYSISDTTSFRMWNMAPGNYRIKFMLKNLNHPGMKGIVKDNYLGSETVLGLNDTSFFNFTVDANPGSAMQMRFQLVYAPNTAGSGPVDVNISSIEAHRKGTDVLVGWNVANETALEYYLVEHASDGRTFKALQQLPAANTQQARVYRYTHSNAGESVHYYRVKAQSLGGRVQYSPVVKVSPGSNINDISIYPNPVVNKTLQLQFSNQQEGRYGLTLVSGNGSQHVLPGISVNAGQSSSALRLPSSLAPGVYQLRFTGPGNQQITRPIQVL